MVIRYLNNRHRRDRYRAVRPVFLLVVIALWVFMPLNVGATLEQMTLTLHGEYQPDFHEATGRLVYVSDRHRFMTVELISPQDDEPVTLHDITSQNSHPRFDKRGRGVYLTTTSSDADGDIVYVPIPTLLGSFSGESVREIVVGPAGDKNPVPSPDGKRLAFVRVERGQSAVWIVEKAVDGERISRISREDGWDPAWMPDGTALVHVRPDERGSTLVRQSLSGDGQVRQLTFGPTIDFSPSVTPDGRYVVFSRIFLDTNGDGRLGSDDRPCLFRLDLATGETVQLTDASSRDYTPRCVGDLIYFSSDRAGNFDIWRTGIEGLFPDLRNEEEQWRLVEEQTTRPGRAAALRRYCDLHDGHPRWNAAAVELAGIYLSLAAYEDSLQLCRRIGESGGPEALEASILSLIVLRRQGTALTEIIAGMEELAASHSGNAAARVVHAMGQLLAEEGHLEQAEDAFRRVEEVAGVYGEIRGQARLERASLMVRRDGRYDDVYRHLRDVWSDESFSRSLRNRAAAVLIDHFFPLGTASAEVPPSLSSLELFCRIHPPDNPAGYLARRRLAEILDRMGDRGRARALYRELVAETGPTTDESLVISLISLLRASDDEPGLLEFFEIMRSWDRGSLLTRLQRELLDRVDRYLATDDNDRALSLLNIVEQHDPLSFEVIKAGVTLRMRQGDRDRLVGDWRERVRIQPADAAAHFGLGLALTWQQEPGRKPLNTYREAIARLEECIRLQPYNPFPYQTLGWIYEVAGCAQATRGADPTENFARAITLYRKAVSLRGDYLTDRHRAFLSLNVGNVYYRLGKFKRAREFYLQWHEASGLAGSTIDTAISYFRFARSSYYAGLSREAVNLFGRATELFNALGERNWLYLTSMETGLASYDHGDYAGAYRAFASARDFLPHDAATHERIINRNMAINSYYAGETARAREEFGRVIEDLESQKDRHRNREKLESHQGFDFSEELKLAYTFIASLYRERGDIARAIAVQQRKLALYKGKGREEWRARLLNTIGELYVIDGQFSEALSAFSRSAELCLVSGQQAGLRKNRINLAALAIVLRMIPPEKVPPLTAAQASALRVMFRQNREAAESPEDMLRIIMLEARLEMLQLAALVRGNGPDGSSEAGTDDRRTAMDGEGDSGVDRLDPQSARAFGSEGLLQSQRVMSLLREVIVQARMQERPDAEVDATLDMADVFSWLDDTEMAGLYLEKGLALASSGHYAFRQFRSIASQAELCIRIGETDRARYLAARAINLYEDMLAGRVYAEVSPTFLPDQRGIYETFIRLLAEGGQTDEAFFYVERMRAANNVLLFSQIDRVPAGDTDGLVQQYRRVQQSIASLWHDSARRNDWTGFDREQARLAGDMDTVLRDMERNAPSLAALTHVRAWQIQEIQGILDTNEAVLLYHVVRDAVYIWLVRPESVIFRSSPITRDRLRGQIAQLIEDVGEPSGDGNALVDELSRLLLGPVATHFEDVRFLTLIVDGELDRLPFSLLRIDENTTLLDRVAMTWLPSASSLPVVLELDNFNQRMFLGVGNPASEPELAAVTLDVGEYFPIFTNRVGETVTVTQFEELERENDFDIIHLAFPVRLHSRNPLLGSIEFSDAERLILRNCTDMKLRANLLSLGPVGEKSGHGVYRDSLASLTGLFFFMGASSVLFPQWSVEDAALHLLYTTFYRGFEARESKASALRQAQLTVRQAHPEPRYWAGYRLYGHRGFNPEEKKNYLLRKLQYFSQRAAKERVEGQVDQVLFSLDMQSEILKEFEGVEERIYRTYFEIVQTAFQHERLETALDYCQRLLKLLEAWRPPRFEQLQAGLYKIRGVIHYRLGHDDEAISDQRASMSVLPAGLVRVEPSIDLARYYMQAGRDEEAIEPLREAQAAAEEADAAGLLGQVLLYRGTVARRLDNYAEGRSLLQRAVKLLEASATESGPDLVIHACHELAIVYEKMGHNDDAYTWRVRALELSRQAGDINRLFLSHVFLGQTHWLRGNITAAHQHVLWAEKLVAQVSLTDADLFDYDNVRGLVLLRLGLPGEAEASFMANVKRARDSGSPRGEATAMNQLGLIALQRGKADDAVVLFESAWELDTREGFISGQGYDARNMARACLDRADYHGARQSADAAIAIAARIDDGRLHAEALFLKGLAAWFDNDIDEAGTTLDEAASLAVARQNNQLLWKIEWLRSRIAARRGDEGEARRLIDKARAAIDGADLSSEAGDRFGDMTFSPDALYRDLVEMLAIGGEHADAFIAAEHSRLIALKRHLGNLPFPVGYSSDERLRQREELLRTAERDIAPSGPETERAHAEAGAAAKGASSPEGDGTIGYEEVVGRLGRTFPWFAGVKVPSLVDPVALQRNLPGNQAILSYFVGYDHCFAWVMTATSLNVVTLPVDPDRLLALCERFRYEIDRGGPVTALCDELSAVLLEPVAAMLGSTEHLVIVPHGLISSVPFAMLPIDGGFAVDRWRISWLPAAQFFTAPPKSPWGSREMRVLAVGNAFNSRKEKQLPYAEHEVRAIVDRFPRTYTLMQSRATEEELVLALPDAEVLHLAAHIRGSEGSPLLQAIELTATADNDGLLTVYELLQLPLNAKLAVISGCASAVATDLAATSALNPAQAFAFAGTPQVIGSQWHIDDRDTARFMTDFYERLRNHPPGKALWLTQKAWRDLGRPPITWAPFVLWGQHQ